MSESTLGSVITEAVAECHRLRDAGASKLQMAQALEHVVRSKWPFTREWKYLCASCNDTGLVLNAEVNKLGIRVETGYPCSCSLGARFRPKQRTDEDAVTAAAKVAKTKPTRFGR